MKLTAGGIRAIGGLIPSIHGRDTAVSSEVRAIRPGLATRSPSIQAGPVVKRELPLPRWTVLQPGFVETIEAETAQLDPDGRLFFHDDKGIVAMFRAGYWHGFFRLGGEPGSGSTYTAASK